jgi:hypothetical protein
VGLPLSGEQRNRPIDRFKPKRDAPQPLYFELMNSSLKSIEQPEPDKGCLIAVILFLAGFSTAIIIDWII